MENLSLLKNFPLSKEGLREVLLLLLLLLSFQPLQAAQKQMLKSCSSFNPINQGSDNYTAADPDSDADGICDALDFCNGGDDLQDSDGDFIPDACDWYGTCADFHILEQHYPATTTLLWEAAEHIWSTDTLAATAAVDYKAGDFIDLLPGFWAKQGAQSRSYIQACPQSASVYKQEDKNVALQLLYDNWLVFPNPSTEKFTFRFPISNNKYLLKISDLQGKLIEEQPIEGTNEQYIWDASSFPVGMYLYTIQLDKEIITNGKIMLLK